MYMYDYRLLDDVKIKTDFPFDICKQYLKTTESINLYTSAKPEKDFVSFMISGSLHWVWSYFRTVNTVTRMMKAKENVQVTRRSSS